MGFDLKYNLVIENENGRDIVRYSQVGIDEGNGFSGLVQDYVGGGQYQGFYFLDGEPATESAEDPDDLDDDAIEEIVEERYPGLMEAISVRLQEWTVPDESSDDSQITLPTAALLERAGSSGRRVVSNYDHPIEVGLTTF